MKEKRIDYVVDHFVDDNGDERDFVIAAISFDLKDEDIWASDMNCGCDFQKFQKGLKVGYSFCRPKYTDKDGVTHEDLFDECLGIEIAVGRARKNEKFAWLAEYEGDINSDTVRSFLERRVKYFKNNPASLITGYKRKK